MTPLMSALFWQARRVLSKSGATAPAPAPPPSPPPSSPGRYRLENQYLFEPVRDPATIPSVYGSPTPYRWDLTGPTARYIDLQTGWPWDNAHGDYVDANLDRQGTVPWASFTADAVSVDNVAYRYTGVSCTQLLQYCQQNDHWVALVLRQDAGTKIRRIASRFHSSELPPQIDVVYTDATTATLACTTCALSTTGSTASNNTSEVMALPVLLEFERPTKAVASAALSITVTNHVVSSGGVPVLKFFLLSPMLYRTGTDYSGVAFGSGPLDLNIESQPGVIGAQRYLDGTQLVDFAVLGSVNFDSETLWSPHLWNPAAAKDYTKLPYAALGQSVAGKWINVFEDSSNAEQSLVGSDYTGEGFVPLFPGLGAMRHKLKNQDIQAGVEYGSAGTAAANAMLLLPEEMMGYQDHLHVRYYVRLGEPWAPGLDSLVEFIKNGVGKFTDHGGKFGIQPCGKSYYGGVSGTSGGTRGWQMRLSWVDYPSDQGGPREGGTALGFHTFDFQNSTQPAAHKYGNESSAAAGWGKSGGGVGDMLYAGRWYLIETELKLNSIDQPSGAGDGLNWTPDGELRAWVDGRLVFERTGMVFRCGPTAQYAYNSYVMRPFRDLGAWSLWHNWFHGGTSRATYDRVAFITGLAYGTQKIGPMKPPEAAGDTLPAWRSGMALNEWRELPGSAMSLAPPSNEAWQVNGTHASGGSNSYLKRLAAWCGLAIDTRASKVWSLANGGHGDHYGNEVLTLDLMDSSPHWVEILPSSSGAVVPSPAGSMTAAEARYTDGKPASAHSYYGQQFIERHNRAIRVGGSLSPGGSGFNDVESYDCTVPAGTSGWDAQYTYPAIDNNPGPHGLIAFGTCKHPTTEVVYVVPAQNGTVRKFTPNAGSTPGGTWSTIAGSTVPFPSTEVSTAIDTTRNRLLAIHGGGYSTGAYSTPWTMDLNTGVWTQREHPESAAADDLDLLKTCPGMVYVPELDAFLVRGAAAGSLVFKIDAETFAVTTISTTGGDSVADGVFIDAAMPYENIRTRWLYVPALGGVVYVPRHDRNAWFLRVV